MGSGTPNTDRAPMIRLTLPGSSRRPRHRPRHPALSVVIPLAPDFPVTDGDCDDSGVSDVSGASGIPDRQDVCALPAPGAPCADDAERAIRSVLDQSLRSLEVLLAPGSPGATAPSAVAATRRWARRDERVRLLRDAGLAAAVRAARAPLLTVLDPRDVVVPGAYETMTASLRDSGSRAVLGAAHARSTVDGDRDARASRIRARLVDAPEAVDEPLAGRLLARTRLWDAAAVRADESAEALAIRTLLSARNVDILECDVLAYPEREGGVDARLARSLMRARALAVVTAAPAAIRSRLLGAWMRDELVDLAACAAELPAGGVERLGAVLDDLLPGPADDAWALLPLLDRALVWTLARGTRGDLDELIASRIEETTVCPIQVVGDLYSPLRAAPPVLDRIADLPAELVAVRSADLPLTATASVHPIAPGRLEASGLAYVRGLSTGDTGRLDIEALDEAGCLLARGRAERRRAPEADLEADDPWRSHIDSGFTAVLDLGDRMRSDGRVRLRAVLTVVDRATTAWLPDLSSVSGAPDAAAAPGTGAAAGPACAGVTLDSACLEDGVLTLEGRAPEDLERLVITARSRRDHCALATARPASGAWRATADLHDAALTTGEHALTWGAGPGRGGPCLAGAFLSAAPVELNGQVRSVRLHAGPDRAMTLTVMAPLTAFERSRYGRTQLATSEAGPIRSAIAFESLSGRSDEGDPAAILADLRAHDLRVPMWWTVLDGAMSAPPGAVPVVRGSRAWFRALRTSRVLITDDILPDWFSKRPGQHVLQALHGAPVGGPHPMDSAACTTSPARRGLGLRRVPQWDLLLARDDEAARHLRAVTGYTGRVLVGRPPRTAGLLAGEEGRRRARAELEIGAGSRVVLYVPARCAGTCDEQWTFEPGRPLDPAELAARTDSVVLVRGPRANGTRARGAAVVDVSAGPNMEDLMLASDVLVTDCPDAVLDYVSTGRPAVLHVPDMNRYRDVERGLYRSWPEGSGLSIAFTRADLIEWVRAALHDATCEGSTRGWIDPAPVRRTLKRVRAWIRNALDDGR